MNVPWEIFIILILFVLLLILALAELISKQTAMAKDVRAIRTSLNSADSKTRERLAELETLYVGPACPVVDRRDRRMNRRAVTN